MIWWWRGTACLMARPELSRISTKYAFGPGMIHNKACNRTGAIMTIDEIRDNCAEADDWNDR